MYDILNSFTANQATGAEPQAITQDANSENILDIGTAGKTTIRPVGSKGPYLIVKCTVCDNEAGSIAIQLRTASNVNLSTGADIIATWSFTHTLLTAAVASGKPLINQQLPHFEYKRYLGLYFDITTTTGSFIAYLSDTPEPAETPTATT